VERPLTAETPLAVEVPLTAEAPPAVATPLTANAMVDKTLWRRRTRTPPAPTVLDLVFMAGPPHQMHSFDLSAARMVALSKNGRQTIRARTVPFKIVC